MHECKPQKRLLGRFIMMKTIKTIPVESLMLEILSLTFVKIANSLSDATY
jgi:hypothetical protein